MDIKEWAQLQESLLKEQLKVVRRFLRGGEVVEKSQQSKEKGMSNICIAENVLREASKPLHVTEIIKRAKSDYQTVIERESIVSAITKKVKKGDTFIWVAPNTFALKT